MLLSGPSLPYPLVGLVLLSPTWRSRPCNSDPVSTLGCLSHLVFLFPLGGQLWSHAFWSL